MNSLRQASGERRTLQLALERRDQRRRLLFLTPKFVPLVAVVFLRAQSTS
jgi:hypothetical protein